MSTVRIEVEGDWAARFDRAPAVLDEALSRGLSRVAEEGAREARAQAPKAFSTLTQSIRASRRGALAYEVAAGVDYALPVELGSGRFGPAGSPSGKLPPVQSLEDWIRVRRIAPDDPGMDTRDLAYVIARSIAARGTPRQPFMAPAYRESRRRGPGIVQRELARGLRAAGLA